MTPARIMGRRKRSEHYVNNKEFLAALIKLREDREIAEIRGNEKPRIPRYIGECFLKIATHLSFKPNFVNYMFKEDMISDGRRQDMNRYLKEIPLTMETIASIIKSRMRFILSYVINEGSNNYRPALWSKKKF